MDKSESNTKSTIAWFSNWFDTQPLRSSAIPKNIRETLLLKRILKFNKVIWVGTHPNPPGCNHHRSSSFGGLLKGIPKYDSKKWKTSGEYVLYITKRFNEIRSKSSKEPLPQCDFVIIRALPSFLYENLKIYILLYQYGLRNTPVLIRDLELVMQKKMIENRGLIDDKPFGISGSDRFFSEEDWEIMSRNVCFLNPFRPAMNDRLAEWSGNKFKFKTFYFPYDFEIYPPFGIINFCDKMLTYIGNDTGRRWAFIKYLRGLSSGFAHVYGGKARQIGKEDKGFPEKFVNKFPNVKFHGPIPHNEVNMVYNNSVACLNLPKPIFNKVGFISARFLEAAFSGAVMFVPEEFKNTMQFGEVFEKVKSSEELEEKVKYYHENYDKKIERIEDQRNYLRKLSNVNVNINRMFEVVEEMS